MAIITMGGAEGGSSISKSGGADAWQATGQKCRAAGKKLCHGISSGLHNDRQKSGGIAIDTQPSKVYIPDNGVRNESVIYATQLVPARVVTNKRF